MNTTRIEFIADLRRSGSQHTRLDLQSHRQGQALFPIGPDGEWLRPVRCLQGDLPEPVFETILHGHRNYSVRLSGIVRQDRVYWGYPAIGIQTLEIIQAAQLDYPMALKVN